MSVAVDATAGAADADATADAGWGAGASGFDAELQRQTQLMMGSDDGSFDGSCDGSFDGSALSHDDDNDNDDRSGPGGALKPSPPTDLTPAVAVQAAALGLCMLGVGAAWAIQYARLPPLLQVLGMSDGALALVWTAGPIAGLVVQPLVGAFSDRCETRYGRRRPFVAVGLLLLVTALVVLGEAPFFARHSLVAAVAAYCVADVAVNTIQLPARAMVADLLPAGQVAVGNAAMAVGDGLGKSLAYGLAATDLSRGAGFLADTRLQCRAAAAIVFASVTVTLAVLREPSAAAARKTSGGRAPSAAGTLRHIAATARDVCACSRGSRSVAYTRVALSAYDGWAGGGDEAAAAARAAAPRRSDVSPLRWCCVVAGLLYFGLAAWQIWGGPYMGIHVWGGDPNAPPDTPARELYEGGVRSFSGSLSRANLLAIAVAVAVPAATRALGSKHCHAGWSVLQALLLAALPAASSGRGSTARLFAAMGIPWALFMNVPWDFVSRAYHGDQDAGLAVAVLNAAVCCAQLAVSAVALLASAAGAGNGNGPAGPIFAVAAVSAAGAAVVSVLCLRVPW